MASCAGVNNPGPIDAELADKLSAELHKCVKKDQLVKAKIALKGLRKDDKKCIVSKTFEGNAPLFIAAQQGLSHFVNYLLNDCQADIEQRGVYEVAEDRSRHHVTPLWCAAVANKLEVVKILIRHSAEVNATSDTESTPVRSACYMTNIEVVKYLTENGADIHKPNINGGTCLINSVQSVDLCRYLIENNANVNAQDNSGNLALHYAIREGRMETVRLMLKHGSDPYVKNDFGDDAVQTAALRGYADILEFLLFIVKPPIERHIEAHELMATNFVDEKHDIQNAINNWRQAMEMRYNDKANIIEKPETILNPAYQNHKEAATMAELEEMATNPDAIYMQALIIRERILGPEHKDTIFGLMYRGAVYADTHRYQRCVDLWKYAFKLRHNTLRTALNAGKSTQGEGSTAPTPLNIECLFSLQALCKLFWEIYEEFTAGFTTELVQFDDVNEVFEMSVSELKRAQEHFAKQASLPIDPATSTSTSITPSTSTTPSTSANPGPSTAPSTSANPSTLATQQQNCQQQQEEFNTIVLLVLHLINLLCAIPKPDKERIFSFKMTVHRLNKLNIRSPGEKSLLHLAVDKKTSSVAEEFYSHFPSENAVKVLLECGADPTVSDNDGNTPLHLLCTAASNISSMTDHVRTPMEGMINALLDTGAHADCVNNNGVIATHRLTSWYPHYRVLDHLTLKCLAARVVKKFNIPYIDADGESQVPFSLLPFLDMH